MAKALLAVTLLLFRPCLVHTERQELSIQLWWELEPLFSLEGEYPVPREKAIEGLLENSRVVFSSMIYGYRFSLVPAEQRRAIQEAFLLEPIAQVRWGDTNLKVVQTNVEQKKLYARLNYRLEDHQTARRESWASNAIPVATGTGASDLFNGPEGRLLSFHEAIRNAIESYARARLLNKPRELTGEILVWEGPQMWIQEGAYVTRVRVKLLLYQVLPYRVF